MPLLVSGIRVACTSVTLPLASFTAPVHSMTWPYLRRTLLPAIACLLALTWGGNRRKKPLGGGLFVVGAFNPDFLADLELAFAHVFVVRVHGGAAIVELARAHDFVPVGEHQLDGVQHGHGARGNRVQGVAQRAFEGAVVDPAVAFGDAYAFGEQLQGFGRVAAAAQADDGGHARVVPAADALFIDELGQLAFAGEHVAEVEAGELVLARVRRGDEFAFGQAVEQPVVEGALVFKLQGADAVGDLLERVFDRVGEGVHGVDAPFVAGVVVVGAAYAVDGRVAHD